MRIDNWGLARKMQLPDWCFGRRFLVSCTIESGVEAAAWDISEIAFPEDFVVWELSAYCSGLSSELISFRMALGDQLPASTAEMDLLEPVFYGLGAQGGEPRAIRMPYVGDMRWCRLRFGIAAAGKRLILEATGVGEGPPTVTVGLTVSSVPREVPDWLLLGQDKNQ